MFSPYLNPYLDFAVFLILIGFLIARAIQWHAASRVYGRSVGEVGYRVWQNQRGSWAGLKVDLTLAVLPAYCVLCGFCTIWAIPPPLPPFWILALVTSFVGRRCLPPSVLYLSTSRRPQLALGANLIRESRPYRVVYLLSDDEESAMNTDCSPDNLRTFGRWDWRLVVHKLMDIVPVIVVDGRFDSPAVVEEITRIMSRAELAQKAILITEPAGECPVLEAIDSAHQIYLPSKVMSVNEAVPFINELLRKV